MVARHRPPSLYHLVLPPDGGWSLAPIENMLRGLRTASDTFSLEMYGRAGVTRYLVRSDAGSLLQGLVTAHYPQSRADLVQDLDDPAHGDWLRLTADEEAVVLPLWLGKRPFLPLKTYSDRDLRETEFDPLTSMVGHLSGIGRWSPGGSGDRLGYRLVLHPAPEQWARNYQRRIQARRDGDDKAVTASSSSGRDQASASATGFGILGFAALAGMAYFNWEWYQAGDYLRMALLDGGGGLALTGGLWGMYKFNSRRSRNYIDEELVEEKIKSLAFRAELQLIRIYSGGDADRDIAEESLERLADSVRQFDNPAGNMWRRGAFRTVTGADFDHDVGDEGLADASRVLSWYNAGRAQKTILSAREVATLWHMPLGAAEAASSERAQSVLLTPYLDGLDKDGPLVGYTPQNHPVHMPDSALAKHTLILGRTGTGKSTLIKQVIYHKMLLKARGEDDTAIVVVDPHADLVRDIMRVVPPSIANQVMLLDLGRDDRIPAVNLIDPTLAPDRDRCVDTIIQTLKGVSDTWGGRLQNILDNGLKALHEYNAHPETPRSHMATLLDLNKLMEDGKVVGTGRDARAEPSAYQKHVLERVSDGHVRAWFKQFQNWPRDTRAEALGPVVSRISGYAGNARAKVVLGQRESTIVFSDVLRTGKIVLVSLASGTIGREPAALMGGTIVSLLYSALLEQEKLPPAQRAKCLLIADEFQTITGTDWEGMLAESRKYGCALMLATQSLAVLDKPERKLQDGIMSNTACLVAYQISAKDADIVSHQMGHLRVTETDLVSLDPHHAYVRITTADKSLPVFSLKTLPPPELEHGSDAAIAAVEAAMFDYTTDRMAALERLNSEALTFVTGDDEKVGPSGEARITERSASGDQASSSRRANPYRRAMPNAEKVVVETVPGLTAEQVAASAYTPSLLNQILHGADHDPGVRAIVDIRLRGRVRARTQEREKELAQREEELNARIAELEAAGRLPSGPPDAPPAVPADAARPSSAAATAAASDGPANSGDPVDSQLEALRHELEIAGVELGEV